MLVSITLVYYKNRNNQSLEKILNIWIGYYCYFSIKHDLQKNVILMYVLQLCVLIPVYYLTNRLITVTAA